MAPFSLEYSACFEASTTMEAVGSESLAMIASLKCFTYTSLNLQTIMVASSFTLSVHDKQYFFYAFRPDATGESH
jgi:hypothetical protein